MNLILLFEKDFQKGSSVVKLSGRRFRYISEIHKAKKGDVFCVGLSGGKIGTGCVIKITSTCLFMNVVLSDNPPDPAGVILALALPRPNVIKRILIAATSLGIKKIIFFHSKRVEKSFWNSPVLAKEKILESCVLGLEQAKDTVLPDVVLKKRFKPFVEDDLPLLLKEGKKGYVAHPYVKKSLPKRFGQDLVLVIGPEGGFISYEIDKLKAEGFQCFSLGKRILRVETVVPYLLGKIF